MDRKVVIPKSVNILGHTYKIVMTLDLKGNEAGVTQFPQRIIKLHKKLTGEMLWLTFLHEIKHAYDFENGDTQLFHPQVQEKQCEQFASFISSLQKQGVL